MREVRRSLLLDAGKTTPPRGVLSVGPRSREYPGQPDGQEDRIHCDDPTQSDNGSQDRVVFVGWRDPLDVIDYRGSCEIVTVVQQAPPGWPY